MQPMFSKANALFEGQCQFAKCRIFSLRLYDRDPYTLGGGRSARGNPDVEAQPLKVEKGILNMHPEFAGS